MRHHYDAMVLGTGGIGSAALDELARRGLHALGIDRFGDGHDRGSSHGATRVIRQAYFEHADYVPLLRQAYQMWAGLEADCGTALYDRVGLLEVGPPDGVVVPNVVECARQHQLDVEPLTAAEVERRFPGVRVPDGSIAVFERDAGYLLVEQCVRAHLDRARRAGAVTVHDQTIRSWNATTGGFQVTTDKESWKADRLIITAGAWAGDLLSDLGLSLRVLRKHLHWLSSGDHRFAASAGFPTFLFELDRGVFYGFPAIDETGVKVGEHSRGSAVADPLMDDRTDEPDDLQRVSAFVSDCLPRLGFERRQHDICFYTMSPDEHFIVDRHPEHDGVSFAAGLSGHGFKFAGVLGKALADLAIDGHTSLPIQFLGLSRFFGQ